MNADNRNWKQLESNIDQDLSSMIDESRIPKIRSQNPLVKIKQNLLINMIWGVLICCLYVIVLIRFNYIEVRLCLGLVLVFSLWALITAFIKYRKMHTGILADSSLLQELKHQHSSIVSWMKQQSRVALFVYPISAAGGFMLGGAVGSGKSVALFMNKPLIWIIFLVVIAILVPLCHLLTKWMFKISFGNHLNALQQYIEELETEK
ncbi:hypothetical protein [Mucilaginibacter psychrotolerans]|uniref:Uncharacterized protein n=1 Tax=Mucilaginibacter psychrotolerans TaxID=1524096 RepID=A0A4Y8SGM1_9SPHI|nr:hypothetical protein [Mucilaginibacter psychrotolerans]TFF38012.1 hypothetical protein E2R66_10535 [Mucilaginibacter psychrotolerans]